MDELPSFKFFCRICSKGFGCGRALGGHMRAHGIIDESSYMNHDDQDVDDHQASGGGGGAQRQYALRPNPSRCRAGENCGKCRSESLVLSSEEEGGYGTGLSRGERSWRRRRMGEEEEDLAHCLVMLSATRVDPVDTESSASGSKEEEHGPAAAAPIAGEGGRMFECKSCKKVFASHQALGGHRASHKKVKGCSATCKLDDESFADEDVLVHDEFFIPSNSNKRKSKGHECSICHRVFASGQALGGHKRCHWVASTSPETSMPKLQLLQQRLLPPPALVVNKPDLIDLNSPAPVADVADKGTRLQLGAAVFLHPWLGLHSSGNEANNNSNGITFISSNMNNNPDNTHSDGENKQDNNNFEADMKIKLRKLSDLKDMSMGGGSAWLQVGIGATTKDCGGLSVGSQT